MFDLLVAALPEKSLSQVMDIIKNIPAINPFEVLKLRLLEAHMLSDQEKMNALFQLGPLGNHKPSQLLASMLSVCPSGMEQPVFLQRLPQTLRTLLGKQECGDIRALAALADRLWASHKPQPHEVMAVQEPVRGGSASSRWPQSSPTRSSSRKRPAVAVVPAAAGRPAATAPFSPMQSRPGWDPAYASSTSATELPPGVAPSPATGLET
jgi:hypothetical protein